MQKEAVVQGPPFYITPEEELALRLQAHRLTPSPVIEQATSFDEYVRQLMIPTTILELARKASGIRFSSWEVEAIRESLQRGLLRKILAEKQRQDRSHPPYIRVACTGKGDFDDLAAAEFGHFVPEGAADHAGDFGSPAILEIWPAGHFSPIHSHGETAGIIYCLTGQIDVMLYDRLDWNAEKLALLTLTPGQCAWLNEKHFPVHKVHCPMAPGLFAATFHVYLNQDELPLLQKEAEPHTRDQFEFIDELPPHRPDVFLTYSDLSWRVLRQELAKYAARPELELY